MSQTARALLISGEEEPLGQLGRILQNLHFEVVRTRSCSEALQAFKEESPPGLVFTDVTLPDGTWQDVLRALKPTHVGVDVILVSRIADDRLYITALESGAADFVVPPFNQSDVAYVVANAVRNSLGRA